MRSFVIAIRALSVAVSFVGAGSGHLFALPRAWAQAAPAGDEVLRQDLADRAFAAHKAGAHQEALELAQRAGQLRRTLTGQAFIAEEQEELGATADALATAQQCVRDAGLDAQAKLRDQAMERCRGVVERLKTRVSRVVVAVPPPPPEGLSVTLSGKPVNRTAINEPYVITAGKVTVEATAPGYVPYRVEIDVPEGQTVHVSIGLARVEQMPPSASVAAFPSGGPAAASTVAEERGIREDGCRPTRSWPALREARYW